jgi:Tol biopolymer transport system component
MLSSRSMRLPIIPITVVAVLMGVVASLITLVPPAERFLGAPIVSALMDIDGVETDVAVAPDGIRYAVISSGDLWFANTDDNTRLQLTDSTEIESSPSWTPDGSRITFTREQDTFVIEPNGRTEELFMADATDLSWSATGQTTFVRGGGLWVTTSTGADALEIVPANSNPDVKIRVPRFSPSGSQIMFILAMLNLRGEIWVADTSTGDAIPIIADRRAENPTAAEWIIDDRHIAYMTDRAGGLAVWYVDLDESTLVPLTTPMMGRSLAPIRIGVHGGRIVLPRHFIDSDIRTSEGQSLVATQLLEFAPAVSRDGKLIAYTVENESRFEIWIARHDGGDPRYLALGRHPRFSPSGNELVYSRIDLEGNKDIWKVDVRTGVPSQLTDAAEIDDVPDWSPDGRSIVFASERDGQLALWTIPSSGGQRLKLNEGGYAPRFSPDGTRMTYWYGAALWTADSDGSHPDRIAEIAEPVFGVWSPTGPVYSERGRVPTNRDGELPVEIWPSFDRLPGGAWVVAELEVEKTELWTLDLVFTE